MTDAIYIQIVLGTFSAIVGGVVAYIGYRMQKRDRKRDALEAERQKQIDTMATEQKLDRDAAKEGILALLRDKLTKELITATHQGYTQVYMVENLAHMYHAYATLGGNGMIKHMYENFEKLPVKGSSGEREEQRHE